MKKGDCIVSVLIDEETANINYELFKQKKPLLNCYYDFNATAYIGVIDNLVVPCDKAQYVGNDSFVCDNPNCIERYLRFHPEIRMNGLLDRMKKIRDEGKPYTPPKQLE